jgi:hypothetical protein
MEFLGSLALLALVPWSEAGAGDDILKIRPPEKVKVICLYPGREGGDLAFGELRSPTMETQVVFSDLLRALGVKTNVLIYIGPVTTVAAVSVEDQPAVVYNPDFLRAIYGRRHNPWSVVTALVHALGHLEKVRADSGQSALSGPESEPERQADHFAGWALRRLGASVDDIVTVLRDEESGLESSSSARRGKHGDAQTTQGGSTGVDDPPSPSKSGSQSSADTASVRASESGRQEARQYPCTHDVPCQHRLPCRHRVTCAHRGVRGLRHGYDRAHPFDLAHPSDPKHPYDTELGGGEDVGPPAGPGTHPGPGLDFDVAAFFRKL